MTSSLHYRLAGSRVVFALYFTSRYPAGALFSPHSDDEALTVNVLLDDHGMFKGGGTEFWAEDLSGKAELPSTDATVRIEPRAGIGVVFNGRVHHAGCVVTAGVRHVLVASFSICSPGLYNSPAFNSPYLSAFNSPSWLRMLDPDSLD